jgi:hypothetical protein
MTFDVEHGDGMDNVTTRMLGDARRLLAAAEQLEHDAGGRESATVVAPVLDCVELTLKALSHTCESAVHSIVPAAGVAEPWSARFARAAADWPLTPVDAAPSFERLAHLVSSLHQAAATLRIAANSTARARDVVAAELPSAASPRAVA